MSVPAKRCAPEADRSRRRAGRTRLTGIRVALARRSACRRRCRCSPCGGWRGVGSWARDGFRLRLRQRRRRRGRRWVADQGALPAFGFGHVQGEHVVIDTQQLGHLADQLVLYALRGELVGLDVELRQRFLEKFVEVLNQGAALGVALPREHAGFAHDRQAFDLMATEAAIEHGGDRGQEILHRVVHAADVRLLYREAIGSEAAGQLGLAQGSAAFLLVELACLLDAEGALDEREAPA
ncbi:hypothetical protein CDEF62S_03011 [Castellaniella defragrans]